MKPVNVEQLYTGLLGPDLKDSQDRYKSTRDHAVQPIDLTELYGIKASQQGQTNSCTGHAVAKLLEACAAKQGMSGTRMRFSANFSYLHSRQDPARDNGAMLRSAALSMIHSGGVLHELWEDSADPLALPSGVQEWPKDRRYYLPSVERVANLPDLLYVLSEEKVPVITGVALQQNSTDALVRAGFATPYNPRDTIIGFHAELAVGWAWIRGEVWVKWVGSWGPDVGQEGCYWRPASYLDNKVVSDMWTVGKEFF